MDGNAVFKKNHSQATISREFIERCCYAAARGITHPSNAGPSGLYKSVNEGKNRTRIGTKVAFHVELTASQQDRDSMVTDRPRKQNFVALTHRSRINFDTRYRSTKTGRCDVHAIGLAVLHNLRVPAGNSHSCFLSRIGDGLNFSLQDVGSQSGFED